jgi:hypothetical protein
MLHSKIIDKINGSLDSVAINILYDFYYNSSCKEVYLENFKSNKLGFSDYRKIYLNPLVFELPITYFLYVVLHEISHQYQYKKYGKDFTLKYYLEPDLYEDFWKTEVVADRLAIIKTLQILRKSNPESNLKLVSVYNTEDKKESVKKYLEDLHKEIDKLGIKTIDEINKHLIQKSKQDVQ